MGFKENETAVMYFSKYIRLLRDIKAEKDEAEEQRKRLEEQEELKRQAGYSNGV